MRLAAVLGEMQGPRVVDLLVDILGCDEPEARHAAGEALAGLAFDRFKEVALGVERALERLPTGNPALAELPYLLAEVPEPGVIKLLRALPRAPGSRRGRVGHRGARRVGQSFGACRCSSRSPPTARKVQLEDEGGTEGEATIAELVAEARSILARPQT